MVKYFLYFLSSLWFLPSAFAQMPDVDSLAKVALTIKYINENLQPNTDSLFGQLSTTKNSDENLNTVYKIINNGNDVSGKGYAAYYKILDWAKQHNGKIIQTAITAELGYNLYLNGNAPEGTKFCLDAVKTAKQIGNDRLLGIVYDNISVVYGSKPLISLEYIKKALVHSIAGNDQLYQGYELRNFAFIFRQIDKMDSARFYAAKSLALAVSRRSATEVANELYAVAVFEKDLSKQLYYLHLAELIAQHSKANSSLLSIYAYVGKYYQSKGKKDSAIYYAQKSLFLGKQFSLVRQLQPLALLMSIYKNINSDSTLKYTDLYYSIKDSINNTAALEKAQAMTLTNQQEENEKELQKLSYANRIRLTIFAAIILLLVAFSIIFWRNNKKIKLANILLNKQKEQVQLTLHDLKATQLQLIQSEKMASLGELTAGIAHEIQNPLNFVNNFSEVNKELIGEMNQEIEKGNYDEVKIIAKDIEANEEKINHHGKRADAIVKGMLQHSRSTSSGTKELTDINALCDEYLRLSYHGLRAKDKSFNATIKTDFDETIGNINIIPQDIGRVVLNLLTNAFYVVDEKKKAGVENYEPTVSISTKKANDKIEIRVSDNGNGIPELIKDKIFQPFFTTKPTGQGTGLGLSLSYDIIKAHGGEIKLETKEGEGTTFSIELPG